VLAVLITVAPAWLFIFAAVVFYVRSGPRRFEFWSLFLLILWIGVRVMNGSLLFGDLSDTLLRNETGVNLFTSYAIPAEKMLSIALPLCALFLLFGLKELLFRRRRYVVLLLSLAIVFWGSLQFFLQAVRYGTAPVLWPLVPFLLLLFWGWFSAYESSLLRRGLGVMIGTLIGLELLWVFTLLPLGFLNASAALLLLFWLMTQCYSAYAAGLLTPARSLAFGAFGTGGLVIIFFLSNWRI
jgi:hypothetical protein